ncbi:MAG TPA: PAS domain-containing protein, partial [Caulobacteraceae bacterium]|nr:PAS domain-containing protein [Caulobacteraceae bacterium]
MPAFRAMPSRGVRRRVKPRDVVFGRVQSDLLSMAESLAGVGYWRYSYADQALFWSDAVYEIYGLRRSEFTPTGAKAIDCYHPDDREAARKAFNDSIANGTSLFFERRLVRADGEVRWVISRAECQKNEAGEAIALIGVFQDVTERRRAEAAQRESTARLARIIEMLPAGAVHVQDGILSMNAAMEKVTGYARHEITSLELWFELLYGDATGKLLERYRRQRANGFPSSVIGQIRRKDGESRQIEFRACN